MNFAVQFWNFSKNVKFYFIDGFLDISIEDSSKDWLEIYEFLI